MNLVVSTQNLHPVYVFDVELDVDVVSNVFNCRFSSFS